MSIEYFVEGKVVTQTEGNQFNFSKGSIAHNSLVNVNQKGTATGVSFNVPNEIHPDDKPVNIIDVSLNVFFDGTQNNKTNTESGISSSSSNGKDSYANDYSNIARGYDAIDTSSKADKQAAVYIEGIGTVDGKRDTNKMYSDYPNNIGSPLGMGDRGIEAKVTKGCLDAGEALGKKFKGKNIDILNINVYGFSRGAAAARHFVHIATKPVIAVAVAGQKYVINPPKIFERSKEDEDSGKNDKQNIDITDPSDPLLLNHGYFGACLIKNGIKADKVVFNFIGLYDTVASFGVNHKGFGIFIDSDAEQLKLNAVTKANFVVQLSSADEYRENFSLTDISSVGINGLEFTLPGVHSDIGGSYLDGDTENSFIYNGTSDDCEKMKVILIDEGWFKNDQLYIFKIEKSVGVEKLGIDYNYSTKYELRGKRALSNHYDRIPLTLIFHYSTHFDVMYNPDRITEDYTITDGTIQSVYSQLLPYINKCHDSRKRNNSGQNYRNELNNISYLSELDASSDLLKLLRNKYLHWSVNIGSGPDSSGMGPHVSKVATFDKRKRFIIPG